MSSRFLIPALCVGAIALACGPRPHNEASASTKRIPAAAAAVVSRPPRTLSHRSRKTQNSDHKIAVAGQLYVHAGDASIRLALHVINTSKRRVELNFPSGQTYDFVILDSLGREVWRWANGRMFTQAVRNKSLSGGESLDLEETWNASAVAPGHYTARGVLTSENYPISQEAEFTVSTTTIASR